MAKHAAAILKHGRWPHTERGLSFLYLIAASRNTLLLLQFFFHILAWIYLLTILKNLISMCKARAYNMSSTKDHLLNENGGQFGHRP